MARDAKEQSIERFNTSIGDFRERFIRHSSIMNPSVPGRADARGALMYHRLEKGLAMENPRPGFGIETVTELLGHLESGKAGPAVMAVGSEVVASYCERQKELGYTFEEPLASRLAAFIKAHPVAETHPHGAVQTREEYFATAGAPFEEFAWGRHCVRTFSGGTVALEDIMKAIGTAQSYPSACNRQPVRAHVFTKKEDIAHILSNHRGGSNFYQKADKLILLTGVFSTLIREEEYSGIILDGGIFLMNLSYALHARRVAHCILNFHMMPELEQACLEGMGIPEGELPICMLLCGEAAETFGRPTSPRMSAEEICTVH